MYSQQTSMAPQKPETFMLSTEAQQALPPDAQVALQQVDNLKYFLISAPVDWQPDQYIRRFLLPTGEYVSCVLWSNLFHISGTDIVRCLSFRFQAFGRPVKNSKKFEEGIFSDLRNLKSGTDASLEEPKSGFLDFLYKNNCIRTQKKQKVFYWYSVPHDRLFLDALERDLKREKMGQEATTVAVSEPALSFQYDSSQSLYEQLTKAQQANSSSFSAQQPTSFAPPQSTSPVMRDMDTMPPPHMMPQSMPPLIDGLEAMVPFQAMTMAPSVVPQHVIKREPDFSRDYGRMAAYQQSGMTAPVAQQRHVSMPAFTLECSPAPSYVSSLYDDYGNRGLSFEPITPPQQTLGMGAEPAYIANDEGGLYGTIPDHLSGGLGGLMHLQPSNLTGQHYSRGFGGNGAYNVIEGCPTYKQRRRRSSIPPPMSAMAAATVTTNTMVHRPSDLRRSVSVSANGALAEGEETDDMSPPGLSYSGSAVSSASQQVKEMLEMSRHNTPLSAIDDSANMNPLNPLNIQQSEGFSMMHDPMSEIPLLDAQRKILHGQPGAIRRARSSTMDIGPYPQKSHSCPIPTCARLFKRLEHLKRHLRTHTHEKPYICPYCNRPFSRSDNLAQHKRTHKEDGEGNFNPSGEEEEDDYSGDDPHGSADNASPTSENAYVTTSIGSVGDLGSHLGAMATGVSMPHTMGRLQNMSMPMSMSTSSTLHASTMI